MVRVATRSRSSLERLREPSFCCLGERLPLLSGARFPARRRRRANCIIKSSPLLNFIFFAIYPSVEFVGSSGDSCLIAPQTRPPLSGAVVWHFMPTPLFLLTLHHWGPALDQSPSLAPHSHSRHLGGANATKLDLARDCTGLRRVSLAACGELCPDSLCGGSPTWPSSAGLGFRYPNLVQLGSQFGGVLVSAGGQESSLPSSVLSTQPSASTGKLMPTVENPPST